MDSEMVIDMLAWLFNDEERDTSFENQLFPH